MIITIDGPVASGKTTVGKKLAAQLGYHYLYSGFLYRTVAYVLIHMGLYPVDTLATVDGMAIIELLDRFPIDYEFLPEGGCQIIVGGNLLSVEQLMNPLMDKGASLVGLHETARALMTEKQQALAKGMNIIADGRDAGSLVFPEANYKFFLTASLEIRAKRYIERQKAQGKLYTLEQAQQMITERDTRDGKLLDTVQLQKDMIVVDTTTMTVEETVHTMLDRVKNHKK